MPLSERDVLLKYNVFVKWITFSLTYSLKVITNNKILIPSKMEFFFAKIFLGLWLIMRHQILWKHSVQGPGTHSGQCPGILMIKISFGILLFHFWYCFLSSLPASKSAPPFWGPILSLLICHLASKAIWVLIRRKTSVFPIFHIIVNDTICYITQLPKPGTK